MKNFNGKAIYNPSGKAGEYSYWACNFYVGCSNGCTYCYLKKGALAHTLGGDRPTLKKCFKNENHALEVFEKELLGNLPELQKHGLFFSFTTDPMLCYERIEYTDESVCYNPNVRRMTGKASYIAIKNKVPVKILTKCASMIDSFFNFYITQNCNKKYIAFGFTLTGHDELEPYASTNAERIEAMKKLHDAGFKTFISVEPIIDFESSWNMISQTLEFCDLYKIGLESNKKYDIGDLKAFFYKCIDYISEYDAKIYFKDGLLKATGFNRENLPSICVDRDYNIFN